MLTHDQEQSLLAAMTAAALEPKHPSKVFGKLRDGRVERYELAQGKKGNSNGALCVYDNGGKPAGWFWTWQDSVKQCWTSFDANALSDAEREEMKKRQAEVNRQREEEQQKVWAEVAAKAERLWNSGGPATAGSPDRAGAPTGEHAYLRAKGVKPYGLKRLRQSLMIPARDATGLITTIQFIQPDGSKRFLTGGKKIGSYFSIGKPGAVLLVCEGFATGASLFEATGYAVAVAFDAGNLLAVCRVLREKFPDALLIVCADNDQATQGNPGLSRAQEAAEQTGSRVCKPEFLSHERVKNSIPTDFNDMHLMRGLAAVKAVVEASVAAPDSAPPAGEKKPDEAEAKSSRQNTKDFEKMIEESDDFEFLTEGLLRLIAKADLKKPAIEYLISKIAKKADTTKAALMDEYKLLAGGGGFGCGPEDSGDDIVQRLNDKHAVVQWEGSTLIASFEKCPITKGRAIKYSSRRDFELRYLNRKTWYRDEEVSIAEYWLHHPDRRQYDGTMFLPGTDQSECGSFLNLWNGWGVTPRQGDCQEYLEFVYEFICSKNLEAFTYLIKWSAHLVQRPQELPETAITLRGGQGLGKNTFVDPLMRIVGSDHAIEVTSADHVTGRFNGHLENALLVFNNESLWGGDKQASGKLKGMITDQRQLVERKGKDAKVSINFRRLINASNNIWSTSVELEDRRNVIVDVVNKAPRETFARLKGLMGSKNSPALQALFHYLLHEVDIQDWHPREIPRSLKMTGREMALESEPTPFRWWNSVLEDRYVYLDSDAYSDDRAGIWPELIEKSRLHDIYLAWCRKRQISHPEGREFFARCLYRCGFSDTRPRKPNGERYNAFKVPIFTEAVRIWCEKFSFDPMLYVDDDELGQGGRA